MPEGFVARCVAPTSTSIASASSWAGSTREPSWRSPATQAACGRSLAGARSLASEADMRIGALYVGSLVGALVVSAILVSSTGGSAFAVFDALLDGSIRSPGAWGLTLTSMAPLLLVAIGAVAATRAGIVNIGQEGQLLVGACFGAFLAVRLPGPGPLVLVCTLLFAALGGGLWAGIAAGLKAWRNVPEVLTTLLLTFISFPLLTFGLRHRWLIGDRDTTRINQINSGEQIPFDTRLPDLRLFG